MAITSAKHKNAKIQRVQTQWPRVSEDVFTKLGIPREELEAIEKQFQGHLVLPGMADYDVDRVSNPLYNMYPAVIAYCATAGDVQLMLNACSKYKKQGQVTCRSGGHSTAGYSVNNAIVIDVSLMNGVTIDQYAMTMTVESGANW